MSTDEMQLILEKDDWLRRMARRLFSDAAGAEDAAQDAWVAKLSREQPASKERPWLGGVLRNLRRQEGRVAGRMGAYVDEMKARGPAQVASTDDVVADLQLREHATRALLALREPLRTTLYLRFVRDLTVGEVGREMGVAQSTVSERLSNGIEALRTELDRSYGDDRQAWLAVLAPTLWNSAGSGAPLVDATSTLGSVAGWGWLAVAAGCVVAAVALVVQGFGSSSQLSHEAEPVPVAAASAALASDEPDEPLTSSEPAELAALAPLAATSGAQLGAAGRVPLIATASEDHAAEEEDKVTDPTRVRARIENSAGAPAPHASWSLMAVGSRTQLAGWKDLEGKTDAKGRIDVSFHPPEGTFIALVVQLDGHMRGGQQWNQLEPGADMELGTPRLAQAGRLHGRLVDSMGQLITGSAHRLRLMAPGRVRGLPLSVGGRHAVDPKSGQFAMANLPPGKAQLNYYVTGTGWVPGPLVEIVAGEAHKVELVYSEAAVLLAAKSRPKRLDLSGFEAFGAKGSDRKDKRARGPKAPAIAVSVNLGESLTSNEIVEAALMGRSLQATVLRGKGPILGPARLSPDDVETLWVRGSNWIARVDDPLAPQRGDAQDKRTVNVNLQLVERRVRFLRDGQPVAGRALQVQVLPMQFHRRPKGGRCKTDADGWTSLKLGTLQAGATYRFSLADGNDSSEFLLFCELPWAGESSDLSASLR